MSRLLLAARYIALVRPLVYVGLFFGVLAGVTAYGTGAPWLVTGWLVALHLLAAWCGTAVTVSKPISRRATELAREQPASYPTT